MKAAVKFIKYCFGFILLGGLLTFCGEKSDPEPSKEELLTKSRSVVSVSVNGQQINSSGFSVNFQNGGNFSMNTPGIPGLPQSGSWQLNEAGNVITLSGSTTLQVRTLTAARFVFEYQYTNHKEGTVTVQFTLE
jgi:hypothetical protein